ncbi:MAG: hypothetical protein HUU37_00290 [Bdellovibrionales bacterium]|nr:hypothetical protein [Bdellovibrionales bacterium]
MLLRVIALAIFILIGLLTIHFPGINADEAYFYRHSLLGDPGIKQFFILPYAGSLKQIFADLWFSLIDQGQVWSPWMIRLPWILLWAAGIGLHATAAHRWWGRRGQMIFLFFSVAHPDLSWSSRADIGENSLSVFFLGLIILGMTGAWRKLNAILPSAALTLAAWNRLNFLWGAVPLLIFVRGSLLFRGHIPALASGSIFGLFLFWKGGSASGGHIDFPWNTSHPGSLFLHLRNFLAGRMAAVNAFHSASAHEASLIGNAALILLVAAIAYVYEPRSRATILRGILCVASMILLHACYTRLIGYWHVAYLLPLGILSLTWVVVKCLAKSSMAGRLLAAILLLCSLSGWLAIAPGRKNLEMLQTKFTPTVSQVIDFCRSARCVASDIGIYDNILTGRPTEKTLDLGFMSGHEELGLLIESAVNDYPHSWFVFWSASRPDMPHNLATFLPAWQLRGLEIRNQRTIDNEEGVPIYVLFQLHRKRTDEGAGS